MNRRDYCKWHRTSNPNTGDCWVGEHWGFVESYGEVSHIHEDEDIICAVSIIDAPPIGKAEDENE